MADYDIRSIFEEMELELIRSMKRNLSRHMQWEKEEEMNWTMWQAEQLKTLEQFKRENEIIFGKKFSIINKEIEEFLKDTYEISGLEQERKILNALTKGKIPNDKLTKGLEGSFFQLNKDKMNALIKATTNDLPKAEHAMLRMVNDQYRKTIFKAEVMANSGAFTLQQSIDMATNDFLKAGINCIEYKNGRRVNIASYAEMCIRTATKRAALISEGDVRNAYGVHTVRITKYGGCSETCLPWQGRVYVDDVYSGGTKEEAKEKNVPLLSEAIAGGLFHPNCKHRSTTYFYDLKKEQCKLEDDGIENPVEEQEHRKNLLHIQQQERIQQGSLDPQTVKEAKAKKEEWIARDEELLEKYPELESDGLDIMKFNQKPTIKVNSDEVVESYLNKINFKTTNEDVIRIVKENMKIMPVRDLKILDDFDVDLDITDKSSRYHSPKLFGKILGDTRRVIYLNPEQYQKGMFAHEFAHFAADVNSLYKDKMFIGLLKNIVENLDGYKVKTINKIDYVYAVSKYFVNDYQGRTYIEKDKFKGVFKPHQLREYISVGYQTYLVNPQFLETRDKSLYDYFERRGLTK